MTSPIYDVYKRVEVRPERGEGAYIWDETGKRYLDFTSGIGVVALGHAHPHLVEALTEQAATLWHVSNIFPITPGEKLAQRLADTTFADKIFFTNSGAEAVECAMKTARRFHFSQGNPERYRIITMEGAFHGRTLATIAAAGKAKVTPDNSHNQPGSPELYGYGPPLEGFDLVPFDDLDAFAAAITAETAAIMVEPIQGEGGIRALSLDTLRGLRDLCDQHGLLLILDEVQCGMGRTGTFFFHEQAGIAPDIMAVAKGIGGGFPLGACLATEWAAKGMTPGTHGSTYGGNFLAMAVGNAVLDIMLEDGFMENVREVGLYLAEQLQALSARHPTVYTGQRGVGLIQGVCCVPPNFELNAALRTAGLLTVNAAGNVLRLLPPLTIGKEHVDEAVALLDEVAANVSSVSS
jgi:acetylornithine/N-succinyldiaminopimelate aminotransferase